ncbi:unnamed protein product [Thlaspi arvense]|uniref:Uncharacterized protein n=1 Tax=Thlaspi arvense TaxID=13288 RepID=A0AAU9RX14_THLAR|nr:unnamed protein product [Thlaspi arvense]
MHPSLLSTSTLSFICEYLKSLGANEEHKDTEAWKKRVMVIWSKPKPKVEEEEEDEAIVESDVDLEGDTAEPDNDLPQKLLKKLSEGKFDEAIEHLTQSVILNPTSAIMYGNRGESSVSVKLKKPNAAVRDANATLEVQCNCVPVVPLSALLKGERRVIIQDDETILLLWYKNYVFAIVNPSPAEGAMVALCAHQRIVHLILEPEKSENENIYISIRDNRKIDAAAEIIFSGKAQPGVTATNVNVDEVNKKDRHEMIDEQFVNQVEMVVAEGSKGFGFSAKNEVINGKAAVIGFLLLTGKGLSKGTAFLDFLCSASDAFK